MKVFIADSSAVVRERLISTLSGVGGVEIIGHAGTAREAVDSIEGLKPDAVVLEMEMSGGGAFLLLQRIKKDGRGPLVIVMSNSPSPLYKRKSVDAGAEFVFDRSKEFDRVIEVLREFI